MAAVAVPVVLEMEKEGSRPIPRVKILVMSAVLGGITIRSVRRRIERVEKVIQKGKVTYPERSKPAPPVMVVETLYVLEKEA